MSRARPPSVPVEELVDLFLVDAAPRGSSGVLRLALLAGAVALAGGLAGPLVTRALHRRR
jgi:hypothetical protein